MQRLAVLLAFAAALLVTTAAFAQAGIDTVLLRNGGRVRGTVMEQDPVRGTSVRLADGTTRQYPASEVADVQYGAAAAPTPPTAPGPVVVAPGQVVAATTPDPPLHIDSPRQVLLQRRLSSFEGAVGRVAIAGADWQDVCISPCDTGVPRNVMLRIGGVGTTPSGLFSLQPDAHQIRVNPGSFGAWFGGIFLATFGGIGVVTGGILAIVGPVSGDDGMTVAGLVTLGISAVPFIIGIIMAAPNGTGVSGETGNQLARTNRPRGPRLVPGGVLF